MKVGILSDTHGNLRLMHRAADLLLARGAEALWHLGDDHPDADELRHHGLPVLVVPGTYAPEYRDGRIPRTRMADAGRLRFLLVHTPEDGLAAVTREPGLAQDLTGVCHGHTHHYRAAPDTAGLLWLNPGHLKRAQDRGRPPSCALLETSGSELAVHILGLDGYTLVEFRRDG